MTDKDKVNILGKTVEAYLWVHSHMSLRALLFGRDPDHTPKYILAHQGRWINRDTLVDLYAIAWPVIGGLLLWLANAPLRGHPLCALFVGLIAIYRLNDLLGAVLYVLIYRARYDLVDARKLVISLLAYVEPILFFSILHGVLSIYLSAGNVGSASVSK